MKVVLIRHAHAVDPKEASTDDSRHLTAKGRKVSRKVGERLRKDGIVFDAMVTSPLVRAVQTAELVAQGAHFDGEVQAVMTLAPGHSIRKAAEDIRAAGEVVAAFGHEPGISALVAHMAGRSAHSSLRKGQAVILEDDHIVDSIDPDDL